MTHRQEAAEAELAQRRLKLETRQQWIEQQKAGLEQVRRNRCAVVRQVPLDLARRFPTVRQQVERDRVAICKLIGRQCLHGSKHVPDSVIVEDITLA